MISADSKYKSRYSRGALTALFAALFLAPFLAITVPVRADAPALLREQSSAHFGYTPRTDVVYFLIEGRRFAVPMNYLIKPREQRAGKTIKTTGFQFDTVWLDGSLKPYSQATKAEFEKLGVNNKVMVLLKARETRPFIDQQYQNAKRSVTESCQDVHIPQGLTCLANPQLRPKDDLFAYSENGQVVYFEYCLKPNSAPHPGCRASTGYTDDVLLNYSYSLKHHNQWREIKDALHRLIRSFEQPTDKP